MTLSIGQVILSVSMLRVIAPSAILVCQFAEWHYVDLHLQTGIIQCGIIRNEDQLSQNLLTLPLI